VVARHIGIASASIVDGILDSYSFVNRRSDLWKITDLLRKSRVFTLADNLRLKTAAQMFQKFGHNLSVKNNVGREITSLGAWSKTLKTTGTFEIKSHNVVYLDIVRPIDKLDGYFTTSNELQKVCEHEDCIAIENFELHHLNPTVCAKRTNFITKCKNFSCYKKRNCNIMP
jgi:hypothetical protein